jgi:hypothetical protein
MNFSPHEKTEAAFVQAMRDAKWPTHYIALTSLSGKTRALFLTPYDSFDAMAKDNDSIVKNTALSASLDTASQRDGELLDTVDQGVMIYNEKESFEPGVDMPHMRYMEITSYSVKPGHRKEWEDMVKMVKDGYAKAALGDVHWATYELAYGGEEGTYLVFSPHRTLDEIDKGFMEDKKFHDAMGEDAMKQLSTLYGEAVSSASNQLFAINPHMSYAPADWVAADPDFWNSKMNTETAADGTTMASPQ